MEAAAFNPVAEDYDAQFTDTAVGKAQRALVRAYLAEILTLEEAPRVLELNCGTGADARWLAEQGAEVLATDLSSGMIAMAKAVYAESPVQWAVGDLRTVVPDAAGPFDLIFSNFGGLNCIPAEDFRVWGRDCFAQLNPGGFWVGVIMSHFCPWEALYYAAKGRPWQGLRRLGRRPLQVPLGKGQFQATWYYGPEEVRDLMGPGWELHRQLPVGFFLPPSYLDPFFARRPRFLNTLAELESHSQDLSRRAAWSDHFLLALQKPLG